MKPSEKLKLIRALFVIGFISIITIGLDRSHIFDLWERKLVDLRIQMFRDDIKPPDDIVVVMIDEASLDVLNSIAGRWPWPRNIHADVIDFLAYCEARAIVMDVMFLESEVGRAEALSLNESDTRLVHATQAAGSVYHAIQIIDSTLLKGPNVAQKHLPRQFVKRFALDVDEWADQKNSTDFYLPYPELYEASQGIGVVNFTDDLDGVYRSERIFFNYDNHFFPAMAVAPLVDQFKTGKMVLRPGAAEIIQDGYTVFSVPLTPKNEYYVNMYGKWDESVIPYHLVYQAAYRLGTHKMDQSPITADLFKDKIVFIGASAAGVYDLKHTAIDSRHPGVFLHASICGNILQSDYLRFCNWFVNTISLIILLIITVFSIFFLKSIAVQIVTPLLSLSCFSLIALWAFDSNIVIRMLPALFAVVAGYVVSFSFVNFTEGKEKRKIKNILGQYVSPAMLSTVLAENKDEYLKAEVGTKETLTVFFSDIRGFTSISEQYPVEKVVEVLNAYLSEMVNIIFNNQGTLDKFIGDAVVAFWGAPVQLADHPYKAVLSAIQMIDAMAPFNAKNRSSGLPELNIGIGIHTDAVILGNIGSEKKLDYTVIGDGVNLTSRLEGLTKFYKSEILISHDTYRYINDTICCRIADYVKVKGKQKPIMIYQVIGEMNNVSTDKKEIVRLTRLAFEAYCDKKFTEARKYLTDISSLHPDDHLADLFIQRCDHYLCHPPPLAWDGSFSHTTK